MTNVLLKDAERIDDLQYKGLKLIQNETLFCFGTDAVLLASFAEIKNDERVVDFCTGTGIIPILLSGREKAREIKGIEIQKDVAAMAKRSVMLNHLEDTVRIITGDIKEAAVLLNGAYDVVTVNPPYDRKDITGEFEDACIDIARREVCCTLEDIIINAGKVLKNGGRFYMIHRTRRLAAVMSLLTKYHLEPKKLRFIQKNAHKTPNYMLIEARKNASEFLDVMAPLIIYDENGQYTEELNKIYHKE